MFYSTEIISIVKMNTLSLLTYLERHVKYYMIVIYIFEFGVRNKFLELIPLSNEFHNKTTIILRNYKNLQIKRKNILQKKSLEKLYSKKY